VAQLVEGGVFKVHEIKMSSSIKLA